MKEWILFCLFLIVGLGMLIAGIIYLQKEKGDKESVTIYRTVSIIGATLTIGALVYRLLI